MTIDGLVESFCHTKTQSETEVRTKFANPLCELLGYPSSNRAEEFPVYGYEGGKAITGKPADILNFLSNEYATNRARDTNQTNWVRNNSLLLVEVKKRGESINAEGQAIYYAAWTRTPFYIITNGEAIRFYKINANFSDTLIVECAISEIPKNWDTIYNNFSFSITSQLKKDTTQISQTSAYDIYLDYCSNMIINLDKDLKRRLGRQLLKASTSYFDISLYTDAKEPLEYKDIFSKTDSVVIVSEPGGGKSYLLSMIAWDALSNISTSNKIPIIVPCEYFNFTFKDIATAIFNTLSPFCPSITNAIVKRDIKDGKYMLLFDALDEVKSDRNVLIGMIKELIISTKNIVAITERQENYNGEFSAITEKYSILPLTDTFISQYISKNTERHLNYLAMHLEKRFMLLLTRPLFLFIFVEILNTHNQTQTLYSVPKNMAVMFDSFFRYPLLQKQLSKAEISLTEQILSLYAEWLMENQESDAKLLECIHEIAGSAQKEKYMDIVIKSGVVIRGVNGFRFFHNTFLEYFFAKSIVQKNSESTITTFLTEHQNDVRYHEIICFMVGITSNENKQNLILDYLQEHNLALFIKALNSRYKFNSLQEDAEYNYSKSYLTQIRNTYLQLIDVFFPTIKKFFSPFNPSTNEKNCKLKLMGNMSPTNCKITVNLVCTTQEDADVDFLGPDAEPTIFIGNDKIPTPLSMSSTSGYYFYNLDALSLGLDSAREIAVDMVKNQLFKFIKDKLILDLNCHILMAEYVEDALDQLRKKRLLPENLTDISLSNNPNRVLAFLNANRNCSITPSGFHGPKISFDLLCYFCYTLINSKKDITQLLLPKQDITTPPKRDTNRIYSFDFFSREKLLDRVKRTFELTERGYEEVLLTHFPKLFDKLVASKSHCCQYIKLNCSGKGWEILETIISTPTRENEILVTFNDSDSSELTTSGRRVSENDKDLLIKIGATEKDIIFQGYDMLSTYLSGNILHNLIYKKLENDFKIIFDEKS